MKRTMVLLVIVAGLMIISAMPTASAGPVITTPIPDITMDEDSPAFDVIDLHGHFSNDIAQLSFSSISADNKIQVEIDDDGIADLIPPGDWYGEEEITFIASDGLLEVSDTIAVTVNPLNDAPELATPLPDIIVNEDEPVSGILNLGNYFHDIDSALIFSYYSNHIQIEISENYDLDLLPSEDWYGTDEIIIYATDGEFDISDTMQVSIRPGNDAPELISPLPDFTIEEDEVITHAFNLNDHFWDIDGTIEFTYSSDYFQVHIYDDGYVDLMPQNDWYGTDEIVFYASDGDLVTSDILTVTVLPVNDAPRALVSHDYIGLNSEDNEKILAIQDYIMDVDDEVLTFEVTGNKHIDYTLDEENGRLILYTPQDWSGEERMTITATDSAGKTGSVQIVVIVGQGRDSPSQLFYIFGMVLAVAIAGTRLKLAGRRRIGRSPVKLSNYRHFRE